jgi:hypothetical protein
MEATYTKLEDGTWGVSLHCPDYPEHFVGLTVTAVTRAGRRSQVTLGEHVRSFMKKGERGRQTDIFRVAS